MPSGPPDLQRSEDSVSIEQEGSLTATRRPYQSPVLQVFSLSQVVKGSSGLQRDTATFTPPSQP